MNQRESNEPAASVIPEGGPQEENEKTASVSLGFVLLKLKDMEEKSAEGEAPTVKDLTELRTNVEEARRLTILAEKNARNDTLTGLPNLRAFDEALYIEMSRLERQRKEGHNYPIYAVKIDLDYFKNINDAFGHAAGNLYLRKVSEHLTKALFRKTDTLARVGGDEFAVLLPNLDSEHVEQVKERLLKAVLAGSAEAKAELGRERGRELAEGEGNVSASMGFELFDGHETPEELLEHADYYSYVAKTAGRNAVVGREMAAELDPDGKIREKFIVSQKGSESR